MLQALVKSTINKQWDPFKDKGETFRLCRVRIRDSRTSSHMGQSLFYSAYLSKWSAGVWKSAECFWASRREKLLWEKLLSFSSRSGEFKVHEWKLKYWEHEKYSFLFSSLNTLFPIFKRRSKEIRNTFNLSFKVLLSVAHE